MKPKQSLSLNHSDHKKQSEWDFYEYGSGHKLIELLMETFPHYLYENGSEGLADVRERKAFEITLYNYRGKKGDDMATMAPSTYFKDGGYSEIKAFIDVHHSTMK